MFLAGRRRQFESGDERSGADHHDPADGRCLGAHRLETGPPVEPPGNVEPERLADPPAMAVGGEEARLLHVVAEAQPGESGAWVAVDGNRHHPGHPPAIVIASPPGGPTPLNHAAERPRRVARAERFRGRRSLAAHSEEEIPPHRQIPTGIGRSAGDGDHLAEGLHERLPRPAPRGMTGEPLRQSRQPVDPFGHRQQRLGRRELRRDERIDLQAQIRWRGGEELLQTPLHPARLRDRDERIGPVADKGHIGVYGHAPGEIEAAPKRGPGRRKIAATEMAVDDGAKHRSIRGGAWCLGHVGIPDRNCGVEIPIERGAEGIADDRLGNRIGRCIVRRDDRTDAGHDVPAVDGHLSFPEQRPRIRPPLPTGGLDPLPEGGGLMEDIERIDPLRDHLAAVGHQIARHGTAARRRATDDLAVGEIDLDHLRRVDGEEQPAVGDHPPTARAGAGEDQRRGPARRPVGERDAVDATTADKDHAAIDDTGDVQPLLARLLPDDAP